MAAARPRRADRTGRSPRQSRRVLAVILVCVAVLGAAAVAFALSGVGVARDPEAPTAEPTAASTAVATMPAAAETAHVAAAMVEVPDVVGMQYGEAQVLLSAAGLVAIVSSDDTSSQASLTVSEQDPVGETLVEGDSEVVLVLAKPKQKAAAAPKKPARKPWVVCIDPGHQARGDSSQEPVGPGASETKPKVTGGATGTKTGIPEYELVLQISMNLKERLEAEGVKVVMTRTTNDVSISNAERAKVAERAHADLFVRVHCDGSTDDEMAGVSTLYPASNRWTSDFSAESKRAAQRVQRSFVAATGAVDRGTKARGDLSGFNWSTVPSLLVECGFLSNPVEDRLLASPHYQDKVAQGIADGIMQHLEGEK